MTQFIAAYAARLEEQFFRSDCLDSDITSSRFETRAIDLFARQFEHNPAYRHLCLAQRLEPGRVKNWMDIPAVPTAAFKELEITCLPPGGRPTVFHSSGTTRQKPSRHFHNPESLALYESSLRNWFAAHLLIERDERLALTLLTPPPEQAPHSSLVHMLAVVRETFGTADSFFAGVAGEGGAWDLDGDRLLPALQKAERAGRPVAILGTAFNFVHLADELERRNLRLQLAPGSRVMETGGYKGRSRALAREELHGLIAERLGLKADWIVCEYGMSELSSQAYDLSITQSVEEKTSVEDISARAKRGKAHPGPVTVATVWSPRLFRFPPWARFVIVSPETGRPAPEGEPGLLRVFDLANVASVLAVQTEDLAVRRRNGFELLGRAALSEPRGCSLMSA